MMVFIIKRETLFILSEVARELQQVIEQYVTQAYYLLESSSEVRQYLLTYIPISD